jgi:hypothetical protein
MLLLLYDMLLLLYEKNCGVVAALRYVNYFNLSVFGFYTKLTCLNLYYNIVFYGLK